MKLNICLISGDYANRERRREEPTDGSCKWQETGRSETLIRAPRAGLN